MKIQKVKKLEPIKIYALFTFAIILVGAIYFKLNIFRFLPLLISVFVMFLQSRVNRFAFLAGALNSLLYGVAGIYMTLYAGAANAFLISFPLQLITFINWNKHTTKGKTETKKLSTKGRIVLLASTVSIWVLLFAIFSKFGSAYVVLDNTNAVISLTATVLCMLRFSEYAIFQLAGSIVGLYLYITMTLDNLSNIVWVFFTVYSLTCTMLAFIKMNKRS